MLKCTLQLKRETIVTERDKLEGHMKRKLWNASPLFLIRARIFATVREIKLHDLNPHGLAFPPNMGQYSSNEKSSRENNSHGSIHSGNGQAMQPFFIVSITDICFYSIRIGILDVRHGSVTAKVVSQSWRKTKKEILTATEASITWTLEKIILAQRQTLVSNAMLCFCYIGNAKSAELDLGIRVWRRRLTLEPRYPRIHSPNLLL